MQNDDFARVQEKLRELESHNEKVIGNLDTQKEEITVIKKTVEQHGDMLEVHGKKIENLKEDVMKIESVIIQENKETRNILQEMLNKQWDLIMSRDMAKGIFNNKMFELLFKMFSVGGIIYLLVERLIS